jgi:hypothetical protein
VTGRGSSWIGLAAPDRLGRPMVLVPSGGRMRLRPPSLRFPVPRREGVPQLDRPTVPPPASGRGETPADVVLVLDDSGSTQSTDPQAWRYVAARRIVNLMVEGIGGEPLDDRVAVVHFADHPQPWLPLTYLDTRARRAAVRTMLRPVVGGGTRIAPAIAKAAGLLQRRREREALVLLFTDGESDEPAADLSAACSRLPHGALHVVVLGGELPAQWRQVPVGTVTRLEAVCSPDEIEWVMAKALYRSLSLSWSGPDHPLLP